MGTMPLDAANQPDPRLDRVFIERERNRFASRALSSLVLLNGAAALVLLAILGRAPEGSVDSKISAALMFFSGGAMAALFSAFIAYINRTLSLDARERPALRRILLILALASVIGSGAAFLTGMNMVGAASAEKTSTHPKGAKEKPSTSPAEKPPAAPTSAPSERADLLPGQKLGQTHRRRILSLKWGLRWSGNLAREVVPQDLEVRGKLVHPLANHVPINHAALLDAVRP